METPNINVPRFVIPATVSPALPSKSSLVIVGKRKEKFHVATGKIVLLYAQLREESVGKAGTSVAVYAVGKYLFIFILHLVYGAYYTLQPILCDSDTDVAFAQTFCMRCTHLRERMSSSIIHAS